MDFKNKPYKIVIALSFIFLAAYGMYAFLSTSATGNVNATIAWGLPLIAMVLFVTGVSMAIMKGHASKSSEVGAKQPSQEQKLIMYGVISIAAGALIGAVLNAPAVFGILGGLGLVLIVGSFTARKSVPQQITNTQQVNPGMSVSQLVSTSNTNSEQRAETAGWLKFVRIIIIVIPILFVLAMVYAVASGHIFDGYQF